MASRTWTISTVLVMAIGMVVAGCRSETDVETETEPETEVGLTPEAERPIGEPVGEAEVLAEEPPATWMGGIEAVGPGIGINGEARATAGETGTFVSIDVEGGQSGSTHPWHVHDGGCGSGGAVVGQETAYPPLTLGAGGEAEAEATIGQRLDPEADYHVNIHLSAAQADSIIACGELVTHMTMPQP